MTPTPLTATPAALPRLDTGFVTAPTRATAAIARLDQALAQHPLLPAFLHRVRLDAVRRQAAVDGRAIDPWHLAAVVEGLRLRLDGAERIIDRGAIFDAARHALTLYQWLHDPDFDQEGEVQRATALLQIQPGPIPLLAAAAGLRAWIEAGNTRAAMRGALVRYWTQSKLLRAPVPLTGAAAFQADQDWAPGPWTQVFLHAVAGEAETWLDLLVEMDRSWRAARSRVAGRHPAALRHHARRRPRHVDPQRRPPAWAVLRRRPRRRGDAPLGAAAVRVERAGPAARRRQSAAATGAQGDRPTGASLCGDRTAGD